MGASGYVVNLATFTLCLNQIGLDYRLAATAAFLVAVTSNFVWNRRWTFAPSPRARHMQALRFFTVSAVAFVLSLGLLQLLVEPGGLPHVLAQALSVAAAMPVTFAGNKLWTFALTRTCRRASASPGRWCHRAPSTPGATGVRPRRPSSW